MLFPFGFSISLQKDLFQSQHPYSNTTFLMFERCIDREHQSEVGSELSLQANTLHIWFPANLVTFTEEILHGKFHFLSSDTYSKFPDGNYMFKVKNRNTRTRCEICSKLPDIWCLYR